MAVSGLDHPPGGFLFPEWVALFTGIRSALALVKCTQRGLGSATRRHAIGRKNWLFSQQPARRHRKRTVIQLDRDGESQRAREAREPYWYLRELFEKLPLARTDYLALLPTARPPQPAP